MSEPGSHRDDDDDDNDVSDVADDDAGDATDRFRDDADTDAAAVNGGDRHRGAGTDDDAGGGVPVIGQSGGGPR